MKVSSSVNAGSRALRYCFRDHSHDDHSPCSASRVAGLNTSGLGNKRAMSPPPNPALRSLVAASAACAAVLAACVTSIIWRIINTKSAWFMLSVPLAAPPVGLKGLPAAWGDCGPSASSGSSSSFTFIPALPLAIFQTTQRSIKINRLLCTLQCALEGRGIQLDHRTAWYQWLIKHSCTTVLEGDVTLALFHREHCCRLQLL